MEIAVPVDMMLDFIREDLQVERMLEMLLHHKDSSFLSSNLKLGSKEWIFV